MRPRQEKIAMVAMDLYICIRWYVKSKILFFIQSFCEKIAQKDATNCKNVGLKVKKKIFVYIS